VPTQIVIPSGEIEQIPCPNRFDLCFDNDHKSKIHTSIMSFSFGFSGDDVGEDNDVVGQTESAPALAQAQSQFVGLPAEEHSLDDLVGPHIPIRFQDLIDTTLVICDGLEISRT